ncbi:MAG TPA: hypothetical protein VIU93_09055 [Gallionellaceae bacterium]
MSLLWRNELRVVLAPEQLALVRLEWGLGGRGPRCSVALKSVVDCPGGDGDVVPWDAALRALDAQLAQLSGARMSGRVILSNHFSRYTMVPWSEMLTDAAEEQAYARHCFHQQYGADVEQWELRLSPERPQLAQLASAVDTRLLDGLRGVFQRNGIALKSIQPHLMAAYNNCRHVLQDCSAWFALYEPGSLCLALLQQGRWTSVRSMRIGNDWRDTLSLQLERAALLAEAQEESTTVFLWAPELEEDALPESGHWQFRYLQPLLRPDLADAYEGRFASALSG